MLHVCHQRIGDGYTFLLLTINALASKIANRVKWILQNPDGYEKARMCFRDLAIKKYAWPSIIEQWETECEEVIQAWKERDQIT